MSDFRLVDKKGLKAIYGIPYCSQYIAVLEKAGSGQFSVELTPGEYGLICFVPDAKDGKLHLMHGMMEQFKVG